MSFLKFLSQEHTLQIVDDLLKLSSTEITKAINMIFSELVECDTHLKVIELLLQDPRVSLNPDNSRLMISACKNGKLEIVKLLLKNPLVDPNIDNRFCNLLFVTAIDRGHFEIVKLLICDTKIDPSLHQNHMIRYASQLGNLEIVKLLLANPKVDSTACDNHAIKLACQHNHFHIVKLLIPKTDLSKITDKKILDIAEELAKETSEQNKITLVKRQCAPEVKEFVKLVINAIISQKETSEEKIMAEICPLFEIFSQKNMTLEKLISDLRILDIFEITINDESVQVTYKNCK
jgi:hypothetical protein